MQFLRVPQRGQHSPSGTVALAQGISGQEILRQTVAEFCTKRSKHKIRHLHIIRKSAVSTILVINTTLLIKIFQSVCVFLVHVCASNSLHSQRINTPFQKNFNTSLAEIGDPCRQPLCWGWGKEGIKPT